MTELKSSQLMIDSSASRFRVTKQNGTLLLEGAITDATTFEMVAELAEPELMVDCSKIVCMGLTGARSLWQALSERIAKIKFVRVPHSVYLILRNTDARDFIESHDTRLAQVASEKNVEIVEVSDSSQVIPGSFQIDFPTWRDRSSLQAHSEVKKWSPEMSEESLFWIDYSGFVANHVVQAEQVLI